jgi:chromosome segregation ATPase
MERNKWETAIRCLEVAVHPNTSDDEMVAAVNGFRRTVEGLPLSQVCLEFACGGVPLADLAQVKDTLERLNRDNLELRRKLAIEEAAQANTARSLDDAYRRIYQLTEEAMAAQRLAEAAEREFSEFRAAYAEALDSMKQSNAGLRSALDEAKRSARRPFSATLAEARLASSETAAFNSGNGSGRLRLVDPGEPWTA